MTSLAADPGPYGPGESAGPPVGQALIAFGATTVVLLALAVVDAAGSPSSAAGRTTSQFGAVALTTFALGGAVTCYRAWTVRNRRAAVIGGLLLGPGTAWAWVSFVSNGEWSPTVNSFVLPGACGLAAVLVVKGIQHRRWLEVFGGLGSLVIGLVAGLLRLEPAAADAPSSALLAAVAGVICLYGLLADLEASEQQSLTELVASRRHIEAEVSRVEELLHDLRSGLLAIETAIGSFDDDLAVPLRAEAARLRRLTVSGERTVAVFDVVAGVQSLVSTRRASGASLTVRAPEAAPAWGEESEVLSIVENLLSNAERHGEPGPIVVHINGDELMTRIAVTSPGRLAPGDPESIFQRGVTTHPDGQGLGLARARMLAGVNGADLRVGPADTGRTTFVLTLRAEPPAAVA